jgi:DNA-directed RNA polymerase specialized sigma24 family protein
MTSSFHDTRWTLVSRSCGSDTQAKAALSELCAAYYAPVVAFLRRDGRTEDEARELAHDFFAKLLAGGAIEGASPESGRFRSYLLGALKHFAADQRDKASAAKRGGGVCHLPLVAPDVDGTTQPGLQLADARAQPPDAEFDRQWALTLLARALAALEMALSTEGKAGHFAVLKPWLSVSGNEPPQAEAAARLDMSEGALKVAIHRLRQRFRDSVRAEIAQTLADDSAVEEELQALRAALRGH